MTDTKKDPPVGAASSGGGQDVNTADKIKAMNQQAHDSAAKLEADKAARITGSTAPAKTDELVVGAGKTERQAALEAAQKILLEHKGLEANIPVNSPYWDYMNKYRSQ